MDNVNVDDVAQAAYLIKHGHSPLEIVPTTKKHSRFVFQNTTELSSLITEWTYSDERKYYIHYRELLTKVFKLQNEEFGGER